MNRVINARELRKSLGDVLHRVEQGERFTVVYRSRLMGQIVPCVDPESDSESKSESSEVFANDDSTATQDLLERLRHRAAQHGVSVQDEIRQILQQAVAAPENLGDLAVRLFSPAYGGDEFILPEREVPEPLEFPSDYS